MKNVILGLVLIGLLLFGSGSIEAARKEPKVYLALLTQIGSNAPTARVIENSIGNLQWQRLGLGKYRATLVDGFPINYDAVIFVGTQERVVFFAHRTDKNTIGLEASMFWSPYWIYTDDALIDTPIEIRLYPAVYKMLDTLQSNF